MEGFDVFREVMQIRDNETFDRYTPEARRSVVFAHFASRAGCLIEPEHLLFGLVRENRTLLSRFQIITEALEDILGTQTVDDGATTETIRTPLANMPFTDQSKRVLSWAAEEAHRMGEVRIGLQHLLLGLLRETDCSAARTLRMRGADIERIRKELLIVPHQPPNKEERMLHEIDEIQKILGSVEAQGTQHSPNMDRKQNTLGRYTTKAHRLIFFAKGVAIRFGSDKVETEHLLLAILREEKTYFALFLPLAESRERIFRRIEEQATARSKIISNEKRLPSDVPLSDECRRAEAYAEEEATLLRRKRVGPEHLLLGMLRQDGCFAARFLREYGAQLEGVRRGLTDEPNEPRANG